MFKGTLEKWFEAKGFGFVRRDGADGWRGVFAHCRQFPPGTQPHEGMRIEFEIKEGDRGPFAANIKILDETDNQAPVQFGEEPEAA